MIDLLSDPAGWAPLLSAFMIGFLGGAHCIGMCGGLMAALSFSVPATEPGRRFAILACYNLGRISSYTLIGALAGWLGYQFAGGHGLSVLRILAGLLLIAMGLYLANWWHGLTYLERLGGFVWRRIQPLAQRLMPVRTLPAALVLGALWGWLPCGLVYTALVYGLAQASVSGSALVMLAFGLGTLPSMLAAGVFAERLKALLQQRQLRVPIALCVMLFGIWTIFAAGGHAAQGTHASHSGHNSESLPVSEDSGAESESVDMPLQHHHH